MAIYAITWQLNSLQPHPEEQEARIIEKIKTLDHFNSPDLAHVWFVSTSWEMERLHRYLYKQFESPDRYTIMLAADVKRDSYGYAGSLGQAFETWKAGDTFANTYQNLDRAEKEAEKGN